jgi:hypothetical protein
MNFELITLADLNAFKNELMTEMRSIRQLLQSGQGTTGKHWLKSSEVRKLLKISSGTLQNLRINGTLNYTKVGGILYYTADDINKIMEQGKAK